jgi:hypothetical protein
MADKIRPQVRKLYDWEIEQISPIFVGSLRYDKVRVCEGYSWPDFANRLGRFVRRQPPPGQGEHNSITLGYHCYFPVLLQNPVPPPGDWDVSNMEWLVHELTHSWQYQHTGSGYLFRALWAQFRFKDAAYEYGGSDGLAACRLEGGTLFSFNPEAQATIVEDYYWRKRQNKDVSAYLPYIEDLQKAA